MSIASAFKDVTDALKHGNNMGALFVAQANLDFGEAGANNRGKFLDAIGAKPGGEWCAAFAGYCYRRAAEYMEQPWPRWTLRGIKPELGAKKLTKNLGAVGRLYRDPAECRPGDLICWHRRTGPISWKGHVGIVERVDDEGLVHTIEGNVGRYPSKVRRFVHDVSKERLYYFASLYKTFPITMGEEVK